MSEMTEFSFHTDPKTVQVAGRRRVLRIFVALAIVALGAVVGIVLVISAPRTAKRPPTKWVPLVEVQTLEPQPRQVTVTAMGTVMPARTVSLKARVAGQVKALHPEFTEGGFVTEGDLLIQLDDADYRLALVQRKSDLVNAGYALALEQGRQQVAKREWALLNNGVEEESDADLALRKPHLEKARADVTAAEAALAKAQLDMARTRIQAPFNALVRSRTVAVGSQVSPQEPLAELVGTDVYWVQATLPVERLDWMTIPAHGGQRGSSAVVQYGAGHEVQGRVVRLLGDLTSGGRMAKVLVAVADPLGPTPPDHRPPLLIGAYVRLKIQGPRLADAFAVPRAALRENDTVWLLDDDNRLKVQKVAPVWRDADEVLLIDALKAGDRLVVSDLPGPVEGMALRLEDTPVEKRIDNK